MKNYIANAIVTALCVTLLCACGGSDVASQTASAQARQLSRSNKSANASYQTAVEELYLAYFGRPADPSGLSNFETALSAANAPTDIQSINAAYAGNPAIQALINSFGSSKESQTLYGSVNATTSTTATATTTAVTTFVTAVFQNVLGRAPQQSGLSYWVGAISSGTLTQGDAALSILAGALSNGTAQGVLDAQLINNRLAIANYFSAQVTTQNGGSSYSGQAAAASARTLLSAVDANTDLPAYETQVAAYVVAMPVPSANIVSYDLEGANVTGSSNGSVTGGFSYNWTSGQVSAFSFATPFGTLDSTVSGNAASIAITPSYTAITFANSQASMTLYYAGVPGSGDIGFFSGVLCTAQNSCTTAATKVPVSTLSSKIWSADVVWVPDMVWVPDDAWVPDVVWVSNWVWVPDVECDAYDGDGNCTDTVDDGYYEDDGSYVDEGSEVDQGSFVDEGGYVDDGAYPLDNFSTGLTVQVP